MAWPVVQSRDLSHPPIDYAGARKLSRDYAAGEAPRAGDVSPAPYREKGRFVNRRDFIVAGATITAVGAQDAAPVRIAVNPWVGSASNVAVAKYLIEEKLGIPVEVLAVPPHWIPEHPTLENYLFYLDPSGQQSLQAGNATRLLPRAMLNSASWLLNGLWKHAPPRRTVLSTTFCNPN